MNTSLFLAQAIGITLSLIAIGLLFSPNTYKKMARGLSKDDDISTMFRFFTGVFLLILGVIMVLVHNIWVEDWKVLVTLFSWLTLLKGIGFLLFPDLVIKIAGIHRSSLLCIFSSFFVLFLGLVFWYFGFIMQA